MKELELLNRPVDEQYIKEAALRLATDNSERIQSNRHSVLIVEVDQSLLALNTKIIATVTKESAAANIPHRKSFVSFTAALGRIIPKVDLGVLAAVKQRRSKNSEFDTLVVIKDGPSYTALSVERVIGVVNLDDSQKREIYPKISERKRSLLDALYLHGDREVALLNSKRLITVINNCLRGDS
jgi:chemotaxis signal transduction protein